MSDIFREVDEDIRQEKYRRLWERFGSWVIVLAVLIVVATGGYRFWQYWEKNQSEQAGDTFFEAMSLSDEGKSEEFDQRIAELAKSTGAYPELSRLLGAAELEKAGKREEALETFAKISSDTSVSEDLRDIATLRSAYLALESEEYPALMARVESLGGVGKPYRFAVREILALSAWKNGDIETARKWISMLQDDSETPGDIARRVEILDDVIAAEHGSVDEEAAEGTNQ